MIEWCHKIVEITQLSRENVAMSMQMVDRFLSTSSNAQVYLKSRSQFQLLSITTLYIAIKFNESVALGSDVVSEISGMYSVEDIEAMERTILKDLNWHIYTPTTSQLTNLILSLLLPHVQLDESMWNLILEEVQYQAEFAMKDYYFSTQRPSTVALAAIFNALDAMDNSIGQPVLLALQALLFVMDEQFAAPSEVFAVMDTLRYLVENDGCIDDDMSMTETSRKLEAGSQKRMRYDTSCDAPSSPRTVTCFPTRRQLEP